MPLDKEPKTDSTNSDSYARAEELDININVLMGDLRQGQNPFVNKANAQRSTFGAGPSSSRSQTHLATSDVATVVVEKAATDKRKVDKAKEYLETHRDALKNAITDADVKTVKLLLGPDLLSRDLEYRRAARENFWQWIDAKINSIVLQAKGLAIVKFLQEQNFPAVLSADQVITLGKQIENNIKVTIKDQEEDIIVQLNILDGSERNNAKKLLDAKLNDANTQNTSENYTDIAKTIYLLAEAYKKQQKTCAKCKEEETRLNEGYNNFNPNQAWLAFNAEMERLHLALNPLRVGEIRESGIAEVPLHEIKFILIEADERISAQSLEDFAVQCYSQDRVSAANIHGSVDKANPGYDQILKILLNHGAVFKVNYSLIPWKEIGKDKSLTPWAAIRAILQNTNAPTQESEATRKELLVLTESLLNPDLISLGVRSLGVSNWLQIFSVSPQVSNIYLGNTCQLLSVLSSGRTGDELDATLERTKTSLEKLPRFLISGPSGGVAGNRTGLFAPIGQNNAQQGGNIQAPEEKRHIMGYQRYDEL